MRFRHERIDSRPPSGRLGSCLVTDLIGNGYPDVIVGGMGIQPPVSFPGAGVLARRLETNLFWYENPGWKRHDIADVSRIDVGGTLGDVTGDGRLDLVVGQSIHHHNLYWLERPIDPRASWARWLITDEFEKYHDVAVGDVVVLLELVGDQPPSPARARVDRSFEPVQVVVMDALSDD